MLQQAVEQQRQGEEGKAQSKEDSDVEQDGQGRSRPDVQGGNEDDLLGGSARESRESVTTLGTI